MNAAIGGDVWERARISASPTPVTSAEALIGNNVVVIPQVVRVALLADNRRFITEKVAHAICLNRENNYNETGVSTFQPLSPTNEIDSPLPKYLKNNQQQTTDTTIHTKLYVHFATMREYSGAYSGIGDTAARYHNPFPKKA